MADSYTDGEIAGIVIGCLIGIPLVIFLILFALRMWMRGPTKGSDSTKKLDGKLVVITGANTGIGKETAIDLAKRGARVIICCRDMTRAEAAAKDIRTDSGSDLVEVAQLDLASLKSVRKCAENLLENEDKIDYLINNAGVMMCPEGKTEDGFDMQMGTNHFGHFAFTELVMPLIRKSSASGHHPRIVIVSSMGHLMARQGINFEDVNYDTDFNTMKAYGISKLANVLHAKELANRLNNTGISVYVLHPGAVNTELSRHIHKKIPSFIACCMIPFFGWIIKSPFHGAQTTLYCTLDDKIECESGKYYSDCAVAPTLTSHAEDMDQAKKLWELSEKVTLLKEEV